MNRQKIERFLSFVIFISTYLLLLTPLIIAYLFFAFITAKTFYVIALSEIIFVSWLILAIMNKKYRPQKNWITISLGLFVLILIISSIFGIDPINSFWSKFDRCTGTILLIHLFLFFLATSSFFKKKDWEGLIFISVIIGLLISSSVIGVALGLEGVFGITSGISFGNSSFLATHLLFVFFLALYLLFENRLSFKKFWIFEEKEIKFLSGLSVVTAGIALVLSTGRAATLSVFACLILFYLFYLGLREKDRALRTFGKILLLLALALILYISIFIHIPGSFAQGRLSELAGESRSIVWQRTLDLVKQRPVIGFGPENFETGFVRVFNSRLFAVGGLEVRYDKAHNIILDTLFSSGMLGLLAYLLIFVSALCFIWKRFLKDKGSFWLASVFTCLLTAYFLQNLTVFDTPTSYLMFFLVLAFLTSCKDRVRKSIPLKVNSLRIISMVLLLSVFGFSFLYFVIRPIESSYLAGKMLAAGFTFEEKTELYTKAAKKSPFGKYQLREYYAIEIGKQFRNEKATKEELEFALGEFEKTVKESPYDFYARINLADLYNLIGKEDKEKLLRAEELLKEAIKISPQNLYSYWYLAETKMLQGQYDIALVLAKTAIAMEPGVSYSFDIYLRAAKLADENKRLEETLDLKVGPR